MNYHKIDTCNMNNGDGLRVVVWVSGCNHYCDNCFNKETWDISSGKPLENLETKLIMDALSKDWCRGITLTGGDPMHPNNRMHTKEICKDIKTKFPNKTIWIYTGYTLDELEDLKDDLVNEILLFTDVIVDGMYDKNLNSPDMHWVGSLNQRVIRLSKK